MTQADALQQAMMRFGASVDALERFLGQRAEDLKAVSTLRDELRTVTDERNRLASERDRLTAQLDSERGRARRLEDANSEVAERLEAVMGALKDMVPGHSAEM